MSRLLILGVVAVVVQSSCATGMGSTRQRCLRRIAEADAVRIAEQFVIDNGYTFSAPSADRTKLMHESIEGFASFDQTVAFRRGTLAPKACGIIASNIRHGREGWTITFCFDGWYAKQVKWSMDLRDRQRMVVMDPDGSNVTMVHEDLTWNEARLKRIGKFDEDPPRRKIPEELAIEAATQYLFRKGFVAGYPNNPERDWPAPADASARVRAVPRLPLWNLACAVVPRDIRRNAEGWSVGFCYDAYVMHDRRISLRNAESRLRFVTMNVYGEEVDMADADGDWDIPGLKRLREPPKCNASMCPD